MKISKILYLTGIIGSMLLSSCNENQKDTQAEPAAVATFENRVSLTENQLEHTDLEIGTPDSTIISSTLKVNGTIELPPKGRYSVSVPYGGFVRNLGLLPGSVVQKGQLLFRIENPEFINIQQNYLKAKSRNEFLEDDYERQKSLFEDEVSSKRLFQQTESEFLQNQAELKGLAARLRLIGIDPDNVGEGNIISSVGVYSPINGKVKTVFFNNGAFGNSRDVILEIYDLEEMHAELKVYENDLKNLEIGDAVTIENTQDPSQTLNATVFLIGAGIGEDRTINVHAEFDELTETLVPGSFISASIEVAPSKTLVLPENALVRLEGKEYVFEQINTSNGNQIYEMKEVTTGRQEGTLVDVSGTQWISTSSKIVVQGGYDLLGVLKNQGE